MKKIVIGIIVAVLLINFLSILTFAHEFWLEPEKFMIKAGEKINFRVFVGENFRGEAVDFAKFKIKQFTHYSLGTEENIEGTLREKEIADFLNFKAEGNHLIVFNNTSKFIELAPEKFNDYLKEEGLDNALEIRKERNELDKNGRELYQRCVKTLLQVGDFHDDTFKRNSGMPLELIPEKNPYLTKDKTLIFKVLFNNQPLENALVLVWQKGVGKATLMKKYRSNSAGEIEFPLKKKGIWMVSTVRMVEHPIKEEADWQSYWGSYTFGFTSKP